jgi:hypothetical protein
MGPDDRKNFELVSSPFDHVAEDLVLAARRTFTSAYPGAVVPIFLGSKRRRALLICVLGCRPAQRDGAAEQSAVQHLERCAILGL